MVYKTMFPMAVNRFSHKKGMPVCKLYFGDKLFILINNIHRFILVNLESDVFVAVPRLLQWLGFWREHDVQVELVESSCGTSSRPVLFSIAAADWGSGRPRVQVAGPLKTQVQVYSFQPTLSYIFFWDAWTEKRSSYLVVMGTGVVRPSKDMY